MDTDYEIISATTVAFIMKCLLWLKSSSSSSSN